MDMVSAATGGMIVRSLTRRIFRLFDGEGAGKLCEENGRVCVDLTLYVHVAALLTTLVVAECRKPRALEVKVSHFLIDSLLSYSCPSWFQDVTQASKPHRFLLRR